MRGLRGLARAWWACHDVQTCGWQAVRSTRRCCDRGWGSGLLEEELLAGESVVFWTDEPLCLPRRRLMVIPRWTLISADVIRRGLGGEMNAGFGWLARAERHLLFLDGDWGGFPVGKGLWRIEGGESGPLCISWLQKEMRDKRGGGSRGGICAWGTYDMKFH